MNQVKRLLLPLLALLLLMPASSLAAKLENLWVTAAQVSDSGDLSAIYWYKNGKQYELFLPSSADASALRVWFKGAENVKINGVTLSSGDIYDFTPGETVTVTSGKSSFSLHVMQSANIAAIYVRTSSGKLTWIESRKGREETGEILVEDVNGKELTRQSLTQIKGHGNASFNFVKKNYQIKLEKGKNLFGMGKNKTWLLVGNYRDKSYLRNRITYDMAKYAGTPYTAELAFADLYINGEYRGIYALTEKVQIDESRIDITDLEKATEAVNGGSLESFHRAGYDTAKKGCGKYFNIPKDPEDITGGYLVELKTYKARYQEAVSAYCTKRGMTVDITSPRRVSKAQYDYLTTLLQQFENAIFASNGVDSVSGKHYTELADLDSLVRQYMIQEITKNYDGNNSSQYFYKPADSESTKLYAGPPWDFDSAYGSYAQAHAKAFLNPTDFYINSVTGKSWCSYWWPALYAHEDFQTRVKEIWQSSYVHALNILLDEEKDPTGTLMSLDEYADLISASCAMDYVRWPRPKNPSSVAKTGSTFSENINYLKTWIRGRRDWLNTKWGN